MSVASYRVAVLGLLLGSASAFAQGALRSADQQQDQAVGGEVVPGDDADETPAGLVARVPAVPAPGVPTRVPGLGPHLTPEERTLLAAPTPGSAPEDDAAHAAARVPLPGASLTTPQPPDLPPATLEAALALAYESNPQLLAARQQVRSIDETVPEALSGWRPHVVVNTRDGGSLYEDNTEPKYNPEHRGIQDYAIQVQQPLYEGGGVLARVQQSDAQVRAARGNLAATEAEVLLAAATAYLDVLRDRRIVALQRNQVILQARTEHASRIELDTGGTTPADLGQAKARTAGAEAQLATAEAQLAASEAQFQRQIGALPPPGPLAVPARGFGLPKTREAAVGDAINDNPDVVAAAFSLDASRHGIDVERANLLPHIMLTGRLQRAQNIDLEAFNQRASIAEGTVDMTFPLYQGGGEYARIRQAKEMTFRLQYVLDDTKRQAQAVTATAWDLLAASRTRVAAERVAIAGNTVAVSGLAQQQSVGARTLLDVLIAEQDLLASNVAEISAERDVLVASLQVLAYTGRLTAEQLALPVVVYDPGKHYRQVRGKLIGTSTPR